MPVRLRHRVGVLWALLALSGCAGWLTDRPPLTDQAVELGDTAFFPQQAYHCGPAALATVLDASGVRTHPDGLAASLYIPERQGTLQVELKAAARRHDRVAVELSGELSALIRQLEAGRPVLVLQNLAVSFYPVWHYAVVVGYLPAGDQFVLRSGEQRRLLTRRNRFDATWRRGGYWGLVVVDPRASPTGLAPQDYLRGAADLENTGAHEPALAAFRSAVNRWPDETLARLGVANNLYYLGRQQEAAEAYRGLLARRPDHPVALHNLVMLLLEMDQPCEARAVIAGATALEGSLVETARRSVASAGTCPEG